MDKYNTFGPRIWAGLVDGLVFMPLGFLDGILTSLDRGASVVIAWSIVSYTLIWLYSVVLHARYGQTLGKMAAKIKVLDVSEDRIPSLRQAFVRDIGYIVINSLTLAYVIYLVSVGRYEQGAEMRSLPGNILTWAAIGWFLLEILTMLSNDKRRAFHDYIAGTVVTRNA